MQNPRSEPAKRVVQCIVRDAGDGGFSRCDGLRRWWLTQRFAVGAALQRALFQRDSANAAKAQIGVDALNNHAGNVLQFESVGAFHPHHEGRRQKIASIVAARRPAQTERFGHGGKPPADDLFPIKNNVGSAESLSGENRIDGCANEIGKRARPGPESRHRIFIIRSRSKGERRGVSHSAGGAR